MQCTYVLYTHYQVMHDVVELHVLHRMYQGWLFKAGSVTKGPRLWEKVTQRELAAVWLSAQARLVSLDVSLGIPS